MPLSEAPLHEDTNQKQIAQDTKVLNSLRHLNKVILCHLTSKAEQLNENYNAVCVDHGHHMVNGNQCGWLCTPCHLLYSTFQPPQRKLAILQRCEITPFFLYLLHRASDLCLPYLVKACKTAFLPLQSVHIHSCLISHLETVNLLYT